MESSETSNFSVQPVIYKRDQHIISRRDMDPDALKIMYRLTRNGYKAYLVGGGVRDLLLRKQPKDFDIATDATPRRVKALFSNSRIIGRRFKLVQVFFGHGKIVEVSTFRDISDPLVENEESNNEETPSPVAHDNKYGDEMTDAQRRDLTINGLFYDATNFSIIDYVGGMKDLQDEVVRIIGDPDVRIAEDPVRMMRAIRHAARTGFSIEQNTWEAIGRKKEYLLKSSPMRVFEELKKDLGSGYFVETARLLHYAGLLELLVPELSQAPSLLFGKASLFSKMLGRADEQCLAGNPPSTTTTLALIALAVRDDGMGEKDLGGLFHDIDDLKEHLDSSFPKLAVPRRERERLQHLLCNWLYLAQTPEDRINPARLRTKECLDDFICFLELVDSSGHMARVFHDISHRPPKAHHQNQRNQGQKRRQPKDELPERKRSNRRHRMG